MLLSIDFDNTYTRDPAFWDEVIYIAKHKHNHKVICVTNRAFPPENVRLPKVELLCAGAEYKQDYAKSQGYNVDVWIDDMPGTICKSVELP
jgi:hypothetical protein